MSGSIERGSDYQPGFDELIPLRKAAEVSGLTVQHLAWLIRKGRLWGTKMGGPNWFSTEEAVREYLSREEKPGPKSKTGSEH